MGNEAQELQRAGACVAELVQMPWRDKHRHARLQPVLLIAVQHDARSFQYEHFMFVSVTMLGGVTAGRDLELPHGKAWSAVRFADQATDPAT